jgi:signal transduction histidine kinase
MKRARRARALTGKGSERTRADSRIKALVERLGSVQEDERRRLSRDLHDQLGQQLTALRLALNVLKDAARDDGIRRQVEHIESIARALDRDVDHLAWELRPPALDELGLATALDSLINQWAQYHGIAATFRAPSTARRLPNDVESNLYRIAQESLHNIAKHARAANVSVALEYSSRRVELTIADDGVGFDAGTADARDGMGLVGMRERAALIGGELLVDSARQRGTVVTARVQLASSRAE